MEAHVDVLCRAFAEQRRIQKAHAYPTLIA